MSGPEVLYGTVVGQDRAVEQLRGAAQAPVHAYLLVGPPGSGVQAAARGFAAQLLCPVGGCGSCEVCARVVAGAHPDVVVVERQGAFVLVDDAREIARLASLSPAEAARRVLVLDEFHLVDKAAPALLKTIEEPPPSTVFLVLAEQVPPELETIASRCVRIDFVAQPEDAVARRLEADPAFAARRAAWQAVPDRLDGTGAAVVTLVVELRAGLDEAAEAVRTRHQTETAALQEQARVYGTRGPGKEHEAGQRREERRVRTDELRGGLAALAGVYRGRLAAGTSGPHVAAALRALDTVEEANRALIRNPSEALWMQALLVRLSMSD